MARASAASRSAERSAPSSMPIESRSSPSPMPALRRASGDIEACVIVAGCATRLSTPPSDSASEKHCSPSRNASIATPAAVQLEAQHRAETVLLARRERMSFVAAQAGPVHARHCRMIVEKLSDQRCVLLVRAHARRERAQAAQRQEAVERRAGEAEAVRPPGETLDDGRVFRDDRAADDVAVAVDVLRRRMHDDVGAERERPLQHRRQERVVDDAARADRVRGLRDVADVGDAQQRVRWRLDPDDIWFLRECFGELRRIGQVGEDHAEAAFPRPRIEQAPGAAVAIVRGHARVRRPARARARR